MVSMGHNIQLSRQEVSAALRAMLLLSPDAVDTLVDSSWYDWTQREELLGLNSLHRLADAVAKHSDPQLADVDMDSEQTFVREKHPSSLHDGKHEEGHSTSGIVCKCGQIHVRRGDRVRRGPAPLEADEVPLIAGTLGTIVRVGAHQETVIVKWDRSLPDRMHLYTWPDPDGYVVAPALFSDVADDVCRLQEDTGLSSVAAEELLWRNDFDFQQALNNFAKTEKTGEQCLETWEQSLRKAQTVQELLYHQVRILPDADLVQQWFDSVRSCPCNKPNCRGGLQWSLRAAKHLGREGLVIQMDADDDSVLVETCGPCTCRMWYPRLAVEKVF